MKRTNKAAWSFVLAMVMVISCTTVAFAAGWNQNGGSTGTTGENTVINPIYEVILPTDMSFAIDPFELKGQGSVASTYYPVINNGNVPVLVGLKFNLDVPTGVKIVETTTGAIATKAAVTEKQVFMMVQFAKGITTVDPNAGTVEGATTAGVTATYAAVTMTAVAPTDPTFKLALKQREYTGDDMDQPGDITSQSAVAFTFIGKVNPGADWQAKDIKVKAAYTLRALATPEFATINDDSTIVDGTRLYTGTEKVETKATN